MELEVKPNFLSPLASVKVMKETSCKELVDFGLCGCDKPVKTVSHEEEIVK